MILKFNRLQPTTSYSRVPTSMHTSTSGMTTILRPIKRTLEVLYVNNTDIINVTEIKPYKRKQSIYIYIYSGKKHVFITLSLFVLAWNGERLSWHFIVHISSAISLKLSISRADAHKTRHLVILTININHLSKNKQQLVIILQIKALLQLQSNRQPQTIKFHIRPTNFCITYE